MPVCHINPNAAADGVRRVIKLVARNGILPAAVGLGDALFAVPLDEGGGVAGGGHGGVLVNKSGGNRQQSAA